MISSSSSPSSFTGARPLAEQNAITRLHIERHDLAGLVARPGADGDHFAFHRLFLGGVGDNDAARGLFFSGQTPDNDPVVQGTELHAERS